MKKDLKYIVTLVTTFLVFVLIQFATPKPPDWTVTFSNKDKIPFGSVILKDVLTDLFPTKSVTHSNETIYEIYEDNSNANVLILCEFLYLDNESTLSLLQNVNDGNSVFIAANNIGGLLADTLNLENEFGFAQNLVSFNDPQNSDTVAISFVNPIFEQTNYRYNSVNMSNTISSFDTLMCSVLAVNANDEPVLVNYSIGKGNLLLSSTPIAFTNYYALFRNNYKFISSTLSYLPIENIVWTEYYQLGRQEPQSPLRFILTTESLRWAYFCTIVGIIVFIIFEAKRRQRIIPIINPLANATVEFAQTIGGLYQSRGDHKDAGEKKIKYFLEFIRSHYYLPTNILDEDFYNRLSSKSGHTREEINHIFKIIIKVNEGKQISSDTLFELNRKIDQFYKDNKTGVTN